MQTLRIEVGKIRSHQLFKALILASSSPRRHQLLRTLGIPFSVRTPDVDERPLPGERPDAHVRRLALTKARDAVRGLDSGSGARWALGADTVVVLDGEILGKPRDARHARAMLGRLAGRTHEVLTGVALVPVGERGPGARRAPVFCARARTAVVRSRVTMRPFDGPAIDRYVASGEPLDKAGSYAVQGRGRRLVVAVEGSLTNVVGLPMERLERLLADCGLAVSRRAVRGS